MWISRIGRWVPHQVHQPELALPHADVLIESWSDEAGCFCRWRDGEVAPSSEGVRERHLTALAAERCAQTR